MSDRTKEKQPMTKYTKGDEIIYMTGPLGAVASVGDTRFMPSAYDAEVGQAGIYVKPIEIGGETWHVTTKTTKTFQHAVPARPLRHGPFIIVAEQMIEPRYRNHAITEEPTT